MDPSLQQLTWALGIVAAAAVTAFWRIMGSISAANRRVDELKDTMNGRIDRVRDEYVRNDQLDVHLRPIHDSLERIYRLIDRHFKTGNSGE